MSSINTTHSLDNLISDFDIVYPQLLTLFKGTLVSADVVYNNALLLIDNFKQSGNPNQRISKINLGSDISVYDTVSVDDSLSESPKKEPSTPLTMGQIKAQGTFKEVIDNETVQYKKTNFEVILDN